MSDGLATAVTGLWLLAGAAVEVLNAWTRHWTAARLRPELRTQSVGWVIGGFVARVVLTAGVLFLAFRHSFVSGLLAWVGYYVCRTLLVRRMSRRLDADSKQRLDEDEHELGSKNG